MVATAQVVVKPRSGLAYATPGSSCLCHGGKMKANEIMTSSPETVTPQDPISRAAQIMRDKDVGLVPVVRDSSSMMLEGVITDRDLAVRHVADGHTKDCSVSSHMSREHISAVHESDDV